MRILRNKGWFSLQHKGFRIFEYSGFGSCAAVYVFEKPILFKRNGKWFLKRKPTDQGDSDA